jgi:hypothetical protein
MKQAGAEPRPVCPGNKQRVRRLCADVHRHPRHSDLHEQDHVAGFVFGIKTHAGQAVGSGAHGQTIGIGAVSKPATDDGGPVAVGKLIIREISMAGHHPLRQTNLCRVGQAWGCMMHLISFGKPPSHR